MRIALVAHYTSGHKIKQVIKNKFPYIEIFYYPYDLPGELPQMFAKLNKRSFDSYLFSGLLPFLRCTNLMLPNIPYFVIRHNEDEIIEAFLRAKIAGYDLDSISFDVYPREVVDFAYEEMHLSQEHVSSYIHDVNMPANHLNQSMVDFHIQNVKKRGAKLVITEFSTVGRELKKFNIPFLKINPTRHSIEEAVYRILLRHRENLNTEGQSAALMVKLCLNKNFTFTGVNENQLSLRKLQLAPLIYEFAQAIEGTVVELDPTDYLIFANRKLLDAEIKDYKNIKLLRQPTDAIFSHFALGVGYGDKISSAKFNAYQALEKAIANPISSLYLISNDIIEGPYSVLNKIKEKNIDSRLLETAHTANVPLEVLNKISIALDVHTNHFFTSKELAELTESNPRQMDRWLKKLLAAGYAKVITKQGQNGAGRPSRVIEILL